MVTAETTEERVQGTYLKWMDGWMDREREREACLEKSVVMSLVN